MNLRFRYFLFIGVLHLTLFVGTYYLFQESPWIFFGIEILVFISFALAVSLFTALIRPVEFMKRGVNALKDQDFNIKFMKSGAREMDELVDVYNKMIDKIRTERIYQQEQHYFMEQVMNSSPTGMIILDLKQNISYINQAARSIFSEYDLDSINSFYDLGHPLISQIKSMDKGKDERITSYEGRQYKCSKSYFLYQGFQRSFLMIEEMTKEVVELEKKAYGKVIRMMAHEVNNSVGAINSIMQTIVSHYDSQIDLEKGDIVDSLSVAINRNKSLNHFMKNFADVIRVPDPQLKQIHVQPWIRSTAAVMEASLSALNIKLTFELPKHPIYIQVDPNLMDQAIVNIIKNSRESIQQDGKIEIILTEDPKKLIIRDNGPGITKKQSSQLFTPFYSSKDQGQGIGLTIIRDVLLKHGFEFKLGTNPNGWTAFEILFN